MVSTHASSGPAMPPPLPATLILAALELQMETADLPQPTDITLTDRLQIELEFVPEPKSLNTVIRWAKRFNGVVFSHAIHDADSSLLHCGTAFDYRGVSVLAYACIPA